MIDVTKHKGIIFQIAQKVKRSYPSIDMNDIIQEINILIMKYSSPIKEGERRTTCYNASMGKESTFITNFIGTKIFQTIKYSGLIDCKSTMSEGKQVYEYMNPSYLSSSIDEKEEIQLGDSLQVVNSYNDMYNNSESEFKFEDILTVANIDKKEKEILTLRMVENKTLKEVGEVFGITSEYVRIIQDKAIAKMKKCNVLKELV
jgi:RNA polymerase sigma factor (sigma-70 family)